MLIAAFQLSTQNPYLGYPQDSNYRYSYNGIFSQPSGIPLIYLMILPDSPSSYYHSLQSCIQLSITVLLIGLNENKKASIEIGANKKPQQTGKVSTGANIHFCMQYLVIFTSLNTMQIYNRI